MPTTSLTFDTTPTALTLTPVALLVLLVLACQVLALARALWLTGAASRVWAARQPTAKPRRAAQAPVVVRPFAGPAPLMDLGQQMARLATIVDQAVGSADNAHKAHVSAGGLLDNAEYQMVKLFEEFPTLRRHTGRPAMVLAPLASQHAQLPANIAA